MTDLPWIFCPGCNTAVAPTRPVCPGCGSCLGCGEKRAKGVKQCPECDLPYCDCCGRCPGCLELRYEEFGPCDCGHPTNHEKLEELVRFNAVVGAETARMPLGCVVTIIGMFVALIIGVAWLL